MAPGGSSNVTQPFSVWPGATWNSPLLNCGRLSRTNVDWYSVWSEPMALASEKASSLEDPVFLSRPCVSPEQIRAAEDKPAPVLRMTHDELDEAERELAEKYGSGRVRDMVHLAHASADLGRSENERHAVLYRVQTALNRGQAEVDAEGLGGLHGDVLKLAAQQGVIVEDDDGGAVRLTDDQGEQGPVALSQETAARRASRAGRDSADSVVARHPELAHLFKAGRTSRRKHPARSGKPVTTSQRAHSSDLEDSPSDHDQPGRGGAVHGEVARYLKMREQEFGGEAGHAGSHGSDSYGPRKG